MRILSERFKIRIKKLAGLLAEDDYSYRGKHQVVRDKTSCTLDDLTKSEVAPDDIYTNMHHYADLRNQDYRESAAVVKYAKGRPDAMVTIYRAVPKGVTTINPGDWITLSKSYAKYHGLHHENPKLNMPVISKRVKASDVAWDGNDLNEFGYFPGNQSEINENVSSDIKIDFSSQKIFFNNEDAGIFETYLSKNGKYLNLDKIFINKGFRGQGIGQEVMKKILEYASKNNLITTVTPDSVWGSSVSKLIKWYKSLGFIMNKGKAKDFEHQYLMYKLP